jgi:hypothetical protein
LVKYGSLQVVLLFIVFIVIVAIGSVVRVIKYPFKITHISDESWQRLVQIGHMVSEEKMLG